MVNDSMALFIYLMMQWIIMTGKLEGKTALITGASRGIGRAIAEKFASEGCRVAINYSHDENAARAVKDATGGEIFRADVSKRSEIRKMADEVHKKMGEIDILVNNAGMWYLLPFEDYDDAKVREMVDLNMFGPIYTTLEFLPDLKRRSGNIINIASNAGIGTAANNTTFYAMTKASIIMLTKRLAFDLKNTGIHVNAIAPGWIETDFTIGGKTPEEVKRLENDFKSRTTLNMFGKPEYIADAAMYLASKDSVYMNGQVLVVDGGRIDNLTHSL